MVESDEDMIVLSSRIADKLRRLKEACSKLRNLCLMDSCLPDMLEQLVISDEFIFGLRIYSPYCMTSHVLVD